VVQVPGVRDSIIAGYPWFSDWGRDTMIALPGLCLTTGRAEIAREILLSFAAYLDHGMLPNRFPDAGEVPEYNTVDATLWYFAAAYRYVTATGDAKTLRASFWEVLERIVQYHQEGTRYNIHVCAEDGLLYAGEPGVQLTWMDAKVGDWVVTPRIGKPVEINALWHNALRTMAHFAERLGKKHAAQEYTRRAEAAAARFAERFPRPDGHGLYDVLDTPGGEPDAAIRPNQIFAVSLPFAPLDAKSPVARSVVDTVQAELLTPCGLRTLSPAAPAYRPRYEGGPWERDSAYHQGTAWPWLLGPFAEAHVKVYGRKKQARAFLEPLRHEVTTLGIGSLTEIYDGSAPQRPNGCFAQAWSIAETLRVWQELR
jgi:predicted glycogen debranching enzyme